MTSSPPHHGPSASRRTTWLDGRTLPWLTRGLTLIALLAVVNVKAASRWETLEAIHTVENPSNSSRPGRFGELGAYQFRASTWKMHSGRPFGEAIDRSASDEVAILHYEWLKNTLAQAGVDPTSYNIALAWNAGANAVIKGRVSSASRDYASRVSNIATSLRASSQIAAALSPARTPFPAFRLNFLPETTPASAPVSSASLPLLQVMD
jgi:hypothetical protein